MFSIKYHIGLNLILDLLGKEHIFVPARLHQVLTNLLDWSHDRLVKFQVVSSIVYKKVSPVLDLI